MLTDGQTDRQTEGETFANLKLLSELKSFLLRFDILERIYVIIYAFIRIGLYKDLVTFHILVITACVLQECLDWS